MVQMGMIVVMTNGDNGNDGGREGDVCNIELVIMLY